MKLEDSKALNKRHKTRILLIMRDPPDTEVNKGGLFPTAIRHHVDLGFDVYVASISRMNQHHKNVIKSLGATPAIPPKTFSTLIDRIGLLSQSKKSSKRGPDLVSKKSLSWVQREICPDIVTGLQSFQTGIIAQKISLFMNIEYITWEHLSMYARGSALPVSDDTFIEFLQNAHAVLAVSSSLREAICQRFSITLSNSHILPNPIPSNFTEPPNLPVPEWLADIPSGNFIFASWTTWRDIKRLDLLLDAFVKVWQQQKNATLIVAGRLKRDAVEIRQAFERQNPDIADSAVFTGSIDRACVRHLAEAAHCCVISSDFETFGLPMAEAIAVGTPVVSTMCGGPEDILVNSCLGELCQKGSSDALSAAMLRVMSMHETFKRDKIARVADELLGDAAIKRKWAAVYEGIVPGFRNEL